MAPDGGLPLPDVLLHLSLASADAEARGGFGDERYEVAAFQDKVRQQVRSRPASLTIFRDSAWVTVILVLLCNLQRVGRTGYS